MNSVDGLLNAMHMGGRQSVVGSASQRLLWPGDIDVYEKVSSSSPSAANHYAERLRGIVQDLMLMNGTRLVQVKLGGTINEPRRWTASEFMKASPEDIVAAVNEPGKCKIDVVSWVPEESRFREVACLYALYRRGKALSWVPPEGQELLASLKHEYTELRREGNYFKACKRLYSIARIEKDTALMKSLQHMFDGPIGAIASLKSEFEAMALLAEVSKQLPKAKVRDELAGAKLRMSRINDATLERLEPALIKEINDCLKDLPRRTIASVRKLGKTCSKIAGRLDGVLQKATHQVYTKV